MSFTTLHLRTFRVFGLCSCVALTVGLGGLRGSQSDKLPPGTLRSPSSKQELTSGPTIRRDESLVLVNASVTDPFGRPITNLGESNFRVFDDNNEQEIVRFSSDDVPVSVGLVLDTSGSMDDKFSESRLALLQFLQTANPDDEFFLTEFSDRARLDGAFTQSIDEIQSRMMSLVPGGRTALFDAVYLSLSEMKQAENKKRALLIISDGGDNHSQYKRQDVVRVLRESDVQLYAIGIYEPGGICITSEECSGPSLLKNLSKTTGGQAFRVSHAADLVDIASKISTLIRSQYVIAYEPNRRTSDAKWHKIKVSIRPPKGLPPLTVHARSGYFGAATAD